MMKTTNLNKRSYQLMLNEKLVQMLEKFCVKYKKQNDKVIRDLNTSIEQMKRILSKFDSNLTKLKSDTQEKLETRNAQFDKHFSALKKDLLTIQEVKHTEEKLYWPQEIDFHRQFLRDFLDSSRMDFVTAFLDAKFGDNYRGDRHGTLWKRSSTGKYERMKHVSDFYKEWAEVCEWDHNRCLENPTDYLPIEGNRAFYDQLDKVLAKGGHLLNEQNFRKFLLYKHKTLEPLRKR